MSLEMPLERPRMTSWKCSGSRNERRVHKIILDATLGICNLMIGLGQGFLNRSLQRRSIQHSVQHYD